ncbi:hypothetical protein [Pseudonocardia acidicola]|uniref:Uncharacterized protein n=1 Tax=Pseudonocardia acidicola TaxID=2724939 RepID=A0ABX1SIF6_9PSEU|nr:hypothetical protein [Pseudonocardia acidicola]NMI01366.1 hypothetical protein [Pseudonocardia acidicola]
MSKPPATEPPPASAELAALRVECALLRRANARLRRQLDDALPVLAALREARIWDFVPYEVQLDSDWLAIDRDDAERLMRALAANDHWRPWSRTLERRLEGR